MFKTAARKIAHNTTMPGLPGLSAKQDLRALQDLITAEKGIMNSLQRLSADFTKAAEALKAWGLGEGDDLADTLSASTTLFLHFSSALSAYASHEVAVREHMKSVRSREESLDELKRRRRSLFSEAESAERKLSKMSPEHKNLQQQTDLLNRLRDEIRTMDTDIMAEEARLGDFKRTSARHWMGLKFGGLLECCEKGAIVGELGKLVIAEIPTAPTEPGLPRPYYTGHARTEFLLAEAARSVAEVFYSPDPNPNPSQRPIRPLPGSELPAVPSPSQRRMSAASMNGQPGFPNPTSPPGTYMGLPQVEESGFNIQGFMSPDQPHSPLSQNPPVNEFGTYSGGPPPQVNSLGAMDKDKAMSPRGGRFATFPVKAAGPRPPPGAAGGSGMSTNPYIAPPLQDGDRAPSLDIDRNDESFSSSVAQALGGKIEIDNNASQSQGASGSSSRFSAPSGPPPPDVKGPDFAPQRYSPPPPMYTPSPSDGNQLPAQAGAAPPNPPSSLQAIAHDRQGAGSRPSSTTEEDVGLAYMAGDHANGSNESVSDSGDRRVRFGGVSDVDKEMEKRHADEEAAAAAQRTRSPPPSQADTSSQQARSSFEVSRSSQPASPTSYAPPANHDCGRSSYSSQPRIPSPPPQQEQQRSAEEDPLDEHSLNAAAAREVSRELDALMMSSPSSPTAPAPPWAQPPRPQYTNPYQRRGVSPRPSLEPTGPATSPKLEGMYVRQRDRSASSPISRIPVPESVPAPASPSGSNDGSDQMQRSIQSIPRISPVPTAGSNGGTPFRTPLETPLAPPPTGSLYNLPGSAGSNSSFSTNPGGVRTISAAAFRRPVRNASGSVVSDGGRQSPAPSADVTPLNVKKRPLPNSPYPPPHLSANLQAPGGMMRSVSAPGSPVVPGGQQGQDGQEQRPLTHYRQDDDFDYISAYTDGQEGGEGNTSGYHQGRFATDLEEGNGVL
ncbi:hypothetical protein FKP32DRAFT_680513 [Trametes sanguinea]|nr:hypothetical protein FKP32DRAFT_680513 [Trametes sanguinea]